MSDELNDCHLCIYFLCGLLMRIQGTQSSEPTYTITKYLEERGGRWRNAMYYKYVEVGKKLATYFEVLLRTTKEDQK